MTLTRRVRIGPSNGAGQPESSAIRAGAQSANELLIGREADLTRILETLEAVRSGSGSVVLLSGEPGIGKTRLAREVLVRAGGLRARTCAGRSFEQHMTVPFFPFTEALTVSLAGPPLLPEATALERWPELARLLPDSGAEQPVHDHDQLQLQVFRAATAFLRSVAEVSPLVMLLDDLHCADTTSLSLLLYLARHLAGARILILGTYRDVGVSHHHPLPETVRDLVRERLADEMNVGRLSASDTAKLVRTRFGAAVASDELIALIHDRADGNPFFTEELVKALRERGVVSQVKDRWNIPAIDQVEVPRSIRSVVDQRISRLTPDAQELLRLASVVGQEFELDALLAASGKPESGVMDELDAALSAGLLRERRGDVERYSFTHALIQQTLYEELPSHRRKRLHRRVGEGLESLGPDKPLVAAHLVRHFAAAGDTERTLRYAIDAGGQAAARYAHAEAARHYQIALERLEERGDRQRAAEVGYRLANELYDLNRLTEALAAYESALSKFEDREDMLGQALVHRGIGRLLHGRYDVAAAVTHLDAALRLWPTDREDIELAWFLVEASRAKFYGGDHADASSLAERALSLAERHGDASLLARALARVSLTRSHDDPRPRVSVELLDRAERVARSAGNWRMLSYILIPRSSALALSGEWDRARADARRAVQAAERSGEVERLAFAYHSVAERCLAMGAWDEGRAAARAGLALDPRGDLKGMPGSTLLAWMDGRSHDAMEDMAAYAADARRRGDLQGLSVGLVYCADMALQVDRLADAEEPAREAAELLRVGGGWLPWPGDCWGPLAEAAVRLGSPDAEEILRVAEHEVTTSEQYAARPQLLRARGLLLQRQDDLDGALEALVTSGDVARSQQARIQLGRTLDVLANVALQRGEPAAAQAITELQQLVDDIGPEARTLAWARRVGTTPETASSRADSRSPTGAVGRLTSREREVAVLLARGLTNRQIADELVIAEGTAGVHVDHILNKLGFRSRAQVAAWTVEHGLLTTGTN